MGLDSTAERHVLPKAVFILKKLQRPLDRG
jgi:hypothetical protein